MAEVDYDELVRLAAQAKGYLRWAVFLLLAMGVILVVDIQLARSIRDQSVAASRLIGQRVFQAEQGRSDERPAADVAAAGDDSGQPGSGRGDAVDGIPPMAEGPDQAGRPKSPGRRGVAQRPSRDEPRA